MIEKYLSIQDTITIMSILGGILITAIKFIQFFYFDKKKNN